MNKENRCFIIAEAGVNHNGDLGLAKKLVDAAKNSGADAIKFQTFTAEKLVTGSAPMAEYQKKNTGKTESQYKMLKKLELSPEHHKILFDYARDKGIKFMSSPFDEDAIDFLNKLGVDIFKVGSSDANNIPFLIKMAKKGKPIILSTGMSDIKEIKESVDCILKINKKLTVLHCTTEYPCPYGQVNLNAMGTMSRELGVPIGYSDHTEGIEIPVAAFAMGAKVIEKHFTLDKHMEGPDHSSSLEPKELAEMVTQIRNVEMALGVKSKKITKAAKKYIAIAKKSVIAREDIAKGAKITEDMLIIKRPGTGLEPKYIYKIIGKKAKKNIKKDELISLRHI